MADNQSIEAPKEEERETEEEREQIEQEDRLQTELQGSLPSVDVASCPSSLVEEFRDQVSQSETLVLPPSLPSSDHDSDCRSIPQLFTGAMASPVENSTEVLSNGPDLKPMAPTVDGDPTGLPVECPPTSLDLAGFKGQFGMSHQEVLASVTDQAQEQKQLQAGYPSPSLEISSDSLAQSISSSPSKTPQQGLPVVPQDNNVRTPEVDQKNSVQKTKPAHVIVKTPCSDGYNWRKYGQKQTKSSGSYQSYFKCTYSDCDAKKKVERCDNSGRVIEVIYKGRHNHDPPRKIRWTKERRLISSVGPVGGCKSIVDHVKKLEHSDPSTSRREFRQSTLPKSEQKRCSTSSSDGGAGHRAEGEHVEEPEPKRRTKDNTVAYSVPLLKTVKEPKIVVQAAGDVGISGDGYRWRKYGQKMVKGNPYPRSYYKCTSFGCPVRKHVEKATDDTTAVIITYEGKHDHDMPIPKKRHGPPSAALLIAAAAAMNNAQFKKSEALSNQGASTQWSMDVEGELTGEKALELGGEKALESARTLLSIGIELKPY